MRTLCVATAGYGPETLLRCDAHALLARFQRSAHSLRLLVLPSLHNDGINPAILAYNAVWVGHSKPIAEGELLFVYWLLNCVQPSLSFPRLRHLQDPP